MNITTSTQVRQSAMDDSFLTSGDLLEFLPRFGWGGIVLVAVLLFSAFSLLYCKEIKRCLIVQNQQLVGAHVQLRIDRNKLLIEMGALSNQRRVQHLAKARLKMHLPSDNELIVLKRDVS